MDTNIGKDYIIDYYFKQYISLILRDCHVIDNSPDLDLKAHEILELHNLGPMTVCASKYGLIRRSLAQSM